MTQVVTQDGTILRPSIRGAGRPIVFLHGWAMGGYLFHDQCRALSLHAQTITYDQRGHGAAQGREKGVSIEQMIADLGDLLEALDLYDAVLVGWSLGAMVAWGATADPRIRRRIGALVTIDMTPRVTNDLTWELGFADGRGALDTIKAAGAIAKNWSSYGALLNGRIYADGYISDPADDQRLCDHVAQLDPEPLAVLWQSMAVQDMRLLITEIDLPTLLIHGAQSKLYRLKTGHYLRHAMPQAELVIFEHSGHAPHIEEAARFTEVMAEFISTDTIKAASFSVLETISTH